MKNILSTSFIAIICLLSYSCAEDELPGIGSIADETPPSAGFTYEADPEDHLKLIFSNTSQSSTDYLWDLGNGESSTEKNPVATYPAVGTYTVTLLASDKLNQSSTTTKEVVTVEPAAFIPQILEAGFEDGALPDDMGDGRDSWRNDAGGVIQITSSPVFDGLQAAKLPSAGDRVGMQAITVVPDTDFNLQFYYTMKEDPGTLTVAILDEMVTDVADAAGATIASLELTDNSDPNTYVQETLTFNSGNRNEVFIYFHNTGSECRLDNFSFE